MKRVVRSNELGYQIIYGKKKKKREKAMIGKAVRIRRATPSKNSRKKNKRETQRHRLR